MRSLVPSSSSTSDDPEGSSSTTRPVSIIVASSDSSASAGSSVGSSSGFVCARSETASEVTSLVSNSAGASSDRSLSPCKAACSSSVPMGMLSVSTSNSSGGITLPGGAVVCTFTPGLVWPRFACSTNSSTLRSDVLSSSAGSDSSLVGVLCVRRSFSESSSCFCLARRASSDRGPLLLRLLKKRSPRHDSLFFGSQIGSPSTDSRPATRID